MKSLNEILAVVIKKDPALAGFDVQTLPLAGKARVAKTSYSGALDREHSHEELMEIKNWSGEKGVLQQAVASFSEGECTYYVFSDQSLYFASSGESDVWAFAADFAAERIINGYDQEILGMDAALLNYLGGHYAETVIDRATVEKISK